MIFNEMHCQSGDIEYSLCGVITVSVVKMNKATNSGAPRLTNNKPIYHVRISDQMKWRGFPEPFHLLTFRA